jgi:hypothetical protein
MPGAGEAGKKIVNIFSTSMIELQCGFPAIGRKLKQASLHRFMFKYEGPWYESPGREKRPRDPSI